MVGARTWARRPHDTGEPISLVISSAMPCMSAWMASDTLVRISARSTGRHPRPRPVVEGVAGRGHGLVDVGFWASGTRPTTSSVVGLITSMVAVPDGSPIHHR